MRRKGQFIVLVGPDGAGKTTLAAAINAQAGRDSAYFHFLPRPPYRIASCPPDVSATMEKNQSGGSRVVGILRLMRNVVRSWLGYYKAVRPALQQGATVVGDRWLYGYLVQPLSLKFHGPRWIARLALFLAPRPDLVVLLEAPSEIINDRKSELTRDEIEYEAEAWRKSVPNTLRLDATLSPRTLAELVLTSGDVPTRFKAYPPGLGHVLLPAAPRKAALHASLLYTPVRRRGIVWHKGSRALLRAIGTAWLRSVPVQTLPLRPTDLNTLLTSLAADGTPVDSVAFHRRTQTARTSFSLVTLGSEGISAFVRVADPAVLDAECRNIAMLETFGPTTFVHPRIVRRGSVGAIEYVAVSPVLIGSHSPPRNPKIGPIVAEIQGALASLPKPAGTPDHWVPMHGDFTPWNLREHRGSLVLIDWESCGWGPPHADEVLYSATARSLGLSVQDGVMADEAAEFWKDRLGDGVGSRDRRLRDAVVKELSLSAE